MEELKSFLASSTFRQFHQQGAIVNTEFPNEDAALALFSYRESGKTFSDFGDFTLAEHEKIPFQNFPYEWSPGMLYEAAHLTLDLAESLLAEGMGLKDATPYNILFRATQPVFVDVLSFENRQANDPIWMALAQFERTFLLPLLTNKYFGIALEQLLTTRREGLEPEEVYKLCRTLQKLRPPFLTCVSIPTWLGRRHHQDDVTIYQKQMLNNPEKARFILETSFKRLRKVLVKLKPASNQKSTWSDYLDANNNYTQEHFQTKEQFVREVVETSHPRKVLDVGCNTGHFSAIAARAGASVVAIDYDPVVVDQTLVRAKAEHLDILPLVVNLTRPTPAMGWRNHECPSFLERAKGKFDTVLMLAVIHHMLVTERIPLAEILQLAAELCTEQLIVEFIAPADSMFRRLMRGREHLFSYLTREFFEETCKRHFAISGSQHLDGTHRWLYWLRKK
ncbi:MAG: class I SAM-dependent methyltransferase [Acidobacteriota bacterium]